MKFMKLGSKPDLFQSNGENTRYVAAELATDIIVNVGNIKFYLHKFPLLSKSARLQNMISLSSDEIENTKELEIHDIPGGPGAFEICAKFCYGMTVTLNAYNVVSARCAAEYLQMHESVEKGNLIYKTEVFLDSSIFKTWKDSIIVYQTTKSFVPWSEELKVVSRCLDSISSKASMDPSRVEWSYTYNRQKTINENEIGIESPLVRKPLTVPKDWWVEDLCDLHVDLYKRVMMTIKARGKVSVEVVGESLKAYVHRRLKTGGRTTTNVDDVKNRLLVETVMFLLPTERNSVSCDLLIRLLKECVRLEHGEVHKLVKRVGQQLQNVSVGDLVNVDVDLVQELVRIFMMQDQITDHGDEHEFLEVKFVDSGAKVKVAKLIDCYLAEVARRSDLPLSKFIDLADMVSTLPRPSHDGIYRAIDMFLKEHPGISKVERKRLCRLMDCRKLSGDACMHAIQNERLPLRIVVQILFFEQMRASTTGSSRSATTNTEEEWDSVPTSEELKTLKGEFASLKMNEGGNNSNQKSKGMHLMSSRILSKLFSGKDKDSDNESSDTSESPCSTSARETKSNTPSRSRRHSTS